MTIPVAAGAAALGALSGSASARTWRDRRQPGAYTSPSGTRIPFEFFDASRETTLRTAVFEFPRVDNAYVQQNGFGARRYPLRCIFWGDQHDLIATAFEAALLEPGIGKLEHPLYGTVNVVPTGDIARRDDPRNEANQSVVEVTFMTTTGAVYPSGSRNPQSEILAALAGFDLAAATQFESSTSLTSAVEAANAIATIRAGIGAVSDTLDEVASAVSTVREGFADLEALVNEGLDVFIGQPLQLALQVSNLIKAPGRALTGIGSRLDAYGNLANRIFGSDTANPSSTLGTTTQALSARSVEIANDFQIADLFAMNAVAGSINAAVADPIGEGGTVPAIGNTFATKPQALNAAAQILAQFDAAIAWRDAGYSTLGTLEGVSAGQVDTGGSFDALQRAAALTAGFLIQISFSLVAERRIRLTRARTIVDLAAEIYGAVDSRLDFLIESNNLSGDEILELPEGREILFYPS